MVGGEIGTSDETVDLALHSSDTEVVGGSGLGSGSETTDTSAEHGDGGLEGEGEEEEEEQTGGSRTVG